MSKIKEKIKNKINDIWLEYESKMVNEIIEDEDFEVIKQPNPKKIKKLAIVVPELKPFYGGHTSILRLGTILTKKNIEVDFVSYSNQEKDEMKKIATLNLKDVKGNFKKYSDAKNEKYDFCVATSWRSFYYAKKMNGYKVYFIQDYEPYFFKVNERYLLAKKTYELGSHMISLGNWNKKQIINNCQLVSKIDTIDFPYEPKEYTFQKREFEEYKNKETIKIAVYAKEEGKRIPNLIQSILIKADEILRKNNNLRLEISFFGFNKKYKTRIGTNLGKLSKEKLNELYNQSDFGMVASMTNISLVPLEMLGTGLPIIEFRDGSYLDFMPEDTAIIIDYNAKTLVNKLIENLQNTEKLENMIDNSKKILNKLSWNNTVNQFYDILEKTTKNYGE